MKTSITVPLPILTSAEAKYRKSMEGVDRPKNFFAPYKNLYEEKDLIIDPSKPVDALTSRKLIEQAAKRVWHNGGVVPKEFADKYLKEFYRQRYFFKLNQEICKKTRSFL